MGEMLGRVSGAGLAGFNHRCDSGDEPEYSSVQGQIVRPDRLQVSQKLEQGWIQAHPSTWGRDRTPFHHVRPAGVDSLAAGVSRIHASDSSI